MAFYAKCIIHDWSMTLYGIENLTVIKMTVIPQIKYQCNLANFGSMRLLWDHTSSQWYLWCDMQSQSILRSLLGHIHDTVRSQ